MKSKGDTFNWLEMARCNRIWDLVNMKQVHMILNMLLMLSFPGCQRRQEWRLGTRGGEGRGEAVHCGGPIQQVLVRKRLPNIFL